MSGGGVMLSGWLKKSPPEKKIRRHAWKKRWFVLKSGRLSGDPNVLEYYKHQAARKPIKCINLNDCVQIDINVSIPVKSDKKDPSRPSFVFDIVTSSRTFYLVADSVREMSSWVHCLCDLCGFNHDSNDKNDLGEEKRTFKPQSMSRNGTTTTSTSLLQDSDVTEAPAPAPRPVDTLTPLSKPVVQRGIAMTNGTANSFQNGYDFPKEDSPFGNDMMSIKISKDSTEDSMQVSGMGRASPKFMNPIEHDTSNGYLHLADCESSMVLLDVEKMDERRCSTDSVFTHDGGMEDSPEETSPGSMVGPMVDIMPSRMQTSSRFLQKVKQGRLSSMPDCPPPLPPTNVPPYSYPPDCDEDDDNVVDARRKPRVGMGHYSTNPLPPIDDSVLYKVPPNLQREHRVNEDGKSITGSTGGTSNSSYGSYIGEMRRLSGKMPPSTPEYINTQDSKGSGSLSSQGSVPQHMQSVSSMYSSPGLTPSSASRQMGRILYDVPSPMSPIFPLGGQESGHAIYQVPQALSRQNPDMVSQQAGGRFGTPTLGSEFNPPRNEHSIRNRLEGMPMLDVGAADQLQTTSNASPSFNINDMLPGSSLYSSPTSLVVVGQSTNATSRETGFNITNSQQSGNTDSTYDAVPPARPPKPQTSNLGLPLDVNVNSPHFGQHLQTTEHESLYSSPRTPSSSSSSSTNRDGGRVTDPVPSSIYDTVRQHSPLSPPHTAIVGSVTDDQISSKVLPFSAAKQRNAISASNSPLTTPNMSRRIGMSKTPSFNIKGARPIQQNKVVSGSAPSLYDVPQQLRSSPGRPEARSSQSSSTSADSSMTGSSTKSSKAETSIYEVPRRANEGGPRSSSPRMPSRDALQEVDDLEHPNYEKMASQHLVHIGSLESDESNPYTIMAGTNPMTEIGAFSPPSHHTPFHPPQTWSKENFGAPDTPPPVHRDLKPGRRSLGSDGGSSQASMERRKNNSRDSFESDGPVSPPHTSIVRSLPMVSEPDMQSRFGQGFATQLAGQPHGTRSNSITSPQHGKGGRMENYNDHLSVSPVPPQRPPKSSHSSLSPRSPPMATPGSQLPGRPYTPTHSLPINNVHDRQFMTPSPSLNQGVPERPPKPAKMKMQYEAPNTQSRDDGFSFPRRPPKSSDEVGFVPSRPPKPSATPSTGDSLYSGSSLHSGLFFPTGQSTYSASTVVPPPAQEQVSQEIKYIEIREFPTQNNTPVHPPSDHGGQELVGQKDAVEYIQLDMEKTRALEKMKMERQSKLHQRVNELHAPVGKGKDKFK